MGPLDGMTMAVTLRQHLPQLKEIFLEGNQLRDRGAEYMFRLLCDPENQITLLSMANNEIGYAKNNYTKGRAVKWLLRVLQSQEKNMNLLRLDLYQNDAFVAFEREIRRSAENRHQPVLVNLKK